MSTQKEHVYCRDVDCPHGVPAEVIEEALRKDAEARVSRLFADMEASKQARMDLGLEG